MKQTVLLVALTGILCLFARAASVGAAVQATPNFTGTWEFTGKGGPRKNQLLVIEHSGDELNLLESFEFEKKPFSRSLKLYSDKRGERNWIAVPGGDSKIEVESETFWKKDKLIRRSSFNENIVSPVGRFSVAHKLTETFSLSKDGSTLIVKLAGSTESPLEQTPRMYLDKKTYRRKF